MRYLYSIIEHPASGYTTLRVWEIVNSTNKFYHIQPRLIPNKDVEKNTTKIRKDETEHPLSYMNKYHSSPQGAMDAFIAGQNNLINRAVADMDRAEERINRANTDLPHQISKV